MNFLVKCKFFIYAMEHNPGDKNDNCYNITCHGNSAKCGNTPDFCYSYKYYINLIKRIHRKRH